MKDYENIRTRGIIKFCKPGVYPHIRSKVLFYDIIADRTEK